MLGNMSFWQAIPVHLGPSIDRLLGYLGHNRYVFFYYESRGEEVIWNDGETYGFGRGGWRIFEETVAPLAARHCVTLSGNGRRLQHVLLVDRQSGEACLAMRKYAETLTTMQHGNDRPVPSRPTSRRDFGSRTNGERMPAREIRMPMLQGMEMFESRVFLSAAIQPALTLLPMAQGSSFQGYTPAQIRHAYGFDQVAADGTGQTIAIVDAFNDPNITADLHIFDQKFGLSDPANFKIVNQTGGSASSVKTDAGWATEIALDVEWAHAIAPNANILLVETSSSSLASLMAGVDYARHAAGVSTVSMSWGGGEFSTEAQYDGLFTTPAGHGGVTFVAASGDSGSWYGPSWPASSPNVLSVGGTSLLTRDAAGTYAGEYGWSGSGGGISYYQPTPSYQTGAQSTGGRTTPDVAFNADPNTGFQVYDSLAYGGVSGWQIVGGTSAGAPQWAALIALADEVRAAAGKGSLDGATATLPALYSLYSKPGTAGYASYLANFNDVTSGWSSWFLRAHAGYDGVTGLGSPKVPQVLAALDAVAPTTSTATGTLPNVVVALPAKAANRTAIVHANAPVTEPTVVSASATATAQNDRLSETQAGSVFSADTLLLHGNTGLAASDGNIVVAGASQAVSSSGTGGAFATRRLIGSLTQSAASAAGGIESAMTHSSPLLALASVAVPEIGHLGEISASAGITSGIPQELTSVGAAAAGALGVESEATDNGDGVSSLGLAIVAAGTILIGYCRVSAAWREKEEMENAGMTRSMFSQIQIEG